MANLGISAFLSKWATKFATNGVGSITGTFMRDFRQDISDSFVNNVDGVAESSVDVSGSALSFDFNSKWEAVFAGSASFATAKSIALANSTNAKRFKFAFEITNIAAELELPSDFTLSDALWERTSSGVWSPLDVGKYLMEGNFINSEWKVTISGPWS